MDYTGRKKGHEHQEMETLKTLKDQFGMGMQQEENQVQSCDKHMIMLVNDGPHIKGQLWKTLSQAGTGEFLLPGDKAAV